jgi:hypothetical protein
MHLNSVGYTDAVLFPIIGNAVNVQWPDISKLEAGKPFSRKSDNAFSFQL